VYVVNLQHLKNTTMKNAFKLPLLALGISLSMAACKGNNSAGSSDTAKTDSSTSVKTSSDTTVKVDTTKAATDTTNAKTDTVTKTTEVKKTAVKKHQ
jgi:hypothetical protein